MALSLALLMMALTFIACRESFVARGAVACVACDGTRLIACRESFAAHGAVARIARDGIHLHCMP